MKASSPVGPVVPAPHEDDLELLLQRWLMVQRAVRSAVSAPSPAAASQALDSALEELGRVGDARTGRGVQLAAQRAVLSDLSRYIARAQRDHGAGTSGLDPCAGTAVAGDVLCLARVGAGDDRTEDAEAMRDLIERMKATVRSYDDVQAVDDHYLLVVLRNVSVPVAWRRVNALVGGRAAVGTGTPSVVRAGLAPVGTAGAAAALDAARAALATFDRGATGWVAVAPGERADDAAPAQVRRTDGGG